MFKPTWKVMLDALNSGNLPVMQDYDKQLDFLKRYLGAVEILRKSETNQGENQ